MRRIIVLSAVLMAPALVQAQPGDNAKPYDLQVVLRFGAHNWLGPQFREDLRGNLGGMLVDALGEIAKVTVVDPKETPYEQWPALWKDVEARGLAALDSAHDATGIKTHFVRIDFVNGQYEIQARQLDGLTGQASPWRREQTPDRAFVARLAGKLIDQDFGLVGTVVGRGDKVQIQFRGGSGAGLERRVARGDVFALVEVIPGAKGEGAAKERVSPVADALLRANDALKNGECAAQVVFRPLLNRGNPLADAAPGHTFRCIKMGNINGPMRLRLVDPNGQPLKSEGLQVWAHPEAFQKDKEPHDEEVIGGRAGVFLSRGNFNQMAFVRVISGGNQIATLPVPILEDRDVVVRVGLDATQDRLGQLEAVHGDLRRQYYDAIQVQKERNRVIKKLLDKAENKAALDESKKARQALEADVTRLAGKKDGVKEQIAGTKISVADCDLMEKQLVDFKEYINRTIGQLEDQIANDNAPDRVERKSKVLALKNKIEAAIANDNYDEALDLLAQGVKEFPEEGAFKSQYNKLLRQWEIKSNEHKQARDFIFKEWATLKTADDISAKLPTARQSLQVCVKAGDLLTIAKLRGAAADLSKVLAGEIEAIRQGGNEDAEKSAKLKKIIEDFDNFNKEIDSALAKQK